MLNVGLRRLQEFRRDVSGMGAVEFALIVPVLLTLYIGGVDLTRAVTFHYRLQQATTAVNDLVAQETDTNKAAITEKFTAAAAMLAGFDMADFKVRVTNVTIDGAGKAVVDWSVSQGLPVQFKGQVYALPKMMASLRDTTVIVTETVHAYAPLSQFVLSKKIAMDAISVGRSRGRKVVTCSDCN